MSDLVAVLLNINNTKSFIVEWFSSIAVTKDKKWIKWFVRRIWFKCFNEIVIMWSTRARMHKHARKIVDAVNDVDDNVVDIIVKKEEFQVEF